MATIVGMPLPEPYSSTVQSVRDDLVAEFDVDPYANPFPHFSLYALADDVDVDAVEHAVAEAASAHDPFDVQTDGVGVFPGNHVWLPVARRPELTALHCDVVDALEEFETAPVPFYEPRRWFPHVGFALGLDDERAANVVEHLLDRDFEWTVEMNEITVTRPPADGERYEEVASIGL
ncbi:2'-5' RNA ligase family protein [Halorubellus litoreus]|uniref:2'-5' RNA ligase family protein n=1 Tax=Halorubellus litoreus TaxID=755308 RepID=A0ABD5VJ36_9EURY